MLADLCELLQRVRLVADRCPATQQGVFGGYPSHGSAIDKRLRPTRSMVYCRLHGQSRSRHGVSFMTATDHHASSWGG
jgi:hypothetical protein